LKTSSNFNLIFFGTDLVFAFGIDLVFSFGVDFIFGLSFLNNVAIGLLIFIFGEKVEMVKEIKEQNLSIFKSLNTSDDFFNLFKKDKENIIKF
jgi:hypothetical protein